MGARVGVWEGLYSAIADAMWEFGSGHLLTRTTAPHSIGDTTLNVESTDRFPSAGNVALDGVVYAYTGTTAVTFTGVAERLGPETVSGTAGLAADVVVSSPLIDLSMSETQLDKLRASMLVRTAVGADLDVLGRNYGVPRPRGMVDADYRDLLKAMIAIDAGTIYALEKVLDVLHGPAGYTISEDLQVPADHHIVKIGLAGSGAVVSQGKSYMAGGEAQPRVTATTVTINDDGILAYGVYEDDDYDRRGTNYAYTTYGSSAGTTAAANPTRLTDSANTPFVSADEGKPILLTLASGQQTHYRIQTQTSTSVVELGWSAQADGRIDIANSNRFITASPWFPEWVVGESPAFNSITIATGANAGTYRISAWISPYEIEISTTFTATETDISWTLEPDFDTGVIPTFEVHRATVSGTTVTTEAAMTVNVLVDYTNVESAQILVDASEDGNAQDPLYLFDGGATTRGLLDALTVAGVRAELELF